MPNHEKWSQPWTVHTSRLLMSKNSIKKVHENLFLMLGRGKTSTKQNFIILPCLLPCVHSPPYLFWRKIGTQSHSARFLNWGYHVNSVPDLAASPDSEYDLLSKLNLLPLKFCREINDLVFFFKCLKNMYKLHISDYVSFCSCTKPLRNVDHLMLNVPFRRTDVFKNYLFVRICCLWNELPLTMRESNTLSIFRKNLMAFSCDKFNVNFFSHFTP